MSPMQRVEDFNRFLQSYRRPLWRFHCLVWLMAAGEASKWFGVIWALWFLGKSMWNEHAEQLALGDGQ